MGVWISPPMVQFVKIINGSRRFFNPRPALAFGYSRCLRLAVRPSVTKFVRAITDHPFKLGSPNLDHRCKRPWLRSVLFWGWLTLTFKVKCNFKSKFTPFWVIQRDNSSPVQAKATKFGPEVLNTLVKIPVVLGIDWAWQVMFTIFS